MSNLVVLGIDPGSRRTGWGLLTIDDERVYVRWGTIALTASSIHDRLLALFDQIGAIVDKYQPNEIAIEDPFLGKNVRSAVVITRAQTALLLGCHATAPFAPITHYAPATVKKQVAGHGRADKREMLNILTQRLQLDTDSFQPSEDAGDALAIAYCHYLKRDIRALPPTLIAEAG